MKRHEQQVLVNVLDDLVADLEDGDYNEGDERNTLFASAEAIMTRMSKRGIKTQDNDDDRKQSLANYYGDA